MGCVDKESVIQRSFSGQGETVSHACEQSVRDGLLRADPQGASGYDILRRTAATCKCFTNGLYVIGM